MQNAQNPNKIESYTPPARDLPSTTLNARRRLELDDGSWRTSRKTHPLVYKSLTPMSSAHPHVGASREDLPENG
jgi:hypothetical protein